ncbi:sulfatase-like hydrolase/transferase [Rhodococcus triatomae]
MDDAPRHAGPASPVPATTTVDRRRVLKSGMAAGVGLVATALGSGVAAAGSRRPNILLLVSEDCGAQHLGIYGGNATTPTIDALAADGVRWTNAFAAAPVCAPSRFAMITGVEPERSAPANHMRAAGSLPPELNGAGWTQYLRDAGYYCTNNAKEDYNASGLDLTRTWDESSPSAHWHNRPAGAPFYAVFNPTMTHELSMAFALPGADALPAGITTPYLRELAAAHAVAPTPILGGPTRPQDVRIPSYHPDTPTTRNDAATYLNQINQMDSELAVRLRELEEAGVADDTIVLYFSDHGGVLPRSKRFCYDSGLRIPLVARFGRNVAHHAPAARGSSVDDVVGVSVDLAPTVLSLAGLPVPRWMNGDSFVRPTRRTGLAFGMRNRMDERYDFVRTVRDERFRYIRNYMPHVPHGQHIQFMWLQAGYREWDVLREQGRLPDHQAGFWAERPAEELYDVWSDPDETTNLVDRPEYATELSRLREALDDHILAINDNGFIPEGSGAEGYLPSRSPADHPLREVMRVAALAITRDCRNLTAFLRSLDHPNPVVRFWAASGLRLLGTGSAPEAAAVDTALGREPSPHVQVVLAESLVVAVDDRAALDRLAWLLTEHPDGWVRLQSANALDRVGARALPVVDALRAASSGVGGSDAVAHTRTAAAHTVRALEGRSAGVP